MSGYTFTISMHYLVLASHMYGSDFRIDISEHSERKAQSESPILGKLH